MALRSNFCRVSVCFAGRPTAASCLASRSRCWLDITDRPIRDYRSAYPTEREVGRQAIFNLGLLNRGVLAAGYGLMALSTPMTDEDIDVIIAAASEALAEVASSA
jgi:glutamate-1-semialdehyde 2,1-aminomutase